MRRVMNENVAFSRQIMTELQVRCMQKEMVHNMELSLLHATLGELMVIT